MKISGFSTTASLTTIARSGVCRAVVFTIYYSLFTIHSLHAAGTSAAEFLKIMPGPRAAAMAGAFTAVADDKNAAYYNPAGLSQLKWNEASVSYNKWLLDTSLAAMSYAHTFGAAGSLSAGLIYYDSGSIEKRGASKDLDGSYKHTGVSFQAAYGNEFHEGLSAGAAVKYAAETLDGDSSGAAAVDFGAHYKTIFDFGETSFGAAAQNIGSQMWDTYSLPSTVRLGAAIKPARDYLTIAADYVMPAAGKPYAALGAEIAPGNLSLRAGYHAGLDDVSGLPALTFGFGYRYTMEYDYIINYAFSTQGDLGMVHRVELGFGF